MNFIGNDHIYNDLISRVQQGTLPALCGFLGSQGIGKRTLARQLAATLLPVDNERKLSQSLDYFETIEKFDASLDIEKMRALRTYMQRTPFGSHKVVVIDGVDALGQGAGNAMLKIFEDLPSHTTVFLLAERMHDIMPTVYSRVSWWYFGSVNENVLRHALAHFSTSPRFEKIIAWSGAMPGTAIALLENETLAQDYEEDETLFLHAHNASLRSRLQMVDQLLPKKTEDKQVAHTRASARIRRFILYGNKELHHQRASSPRENGFMHAWMLWLDVCHGILQELNHHVQIKTAMDKIMIALPKTIETH